VLAYLVCIFAARDQFPDLCKIVLESREYSYTHFNDMKNMCGYPLNKFSERGIGLRYVHAVREGLGWWKWHDATWSQALAYSKQRLWCQTRRRWTTNDDMSI
jgi:hypothetical protein